MLVRQQVSQIVILCDTKCKVEKLKMVLRQLGFDFCFKVATNGQSDRLGLLWRDGIQLHILSSSRNHIDSKIGGIGDRVLQESSYRRKSWILKPASIFVRDRLPL